MTFRNVEARIMKLQARHRRPDEILLIWRKPGADVARAVAGAQFSKGDKAICVEWFGESPLPAPQWYRERLSSQLGAVQNEYLNRSLNRVLESASPRDPGFAEPPNVSAHRARELADNDLLHFVFGIAT